MRSDRYRNIILTLIAFALCVIALPKLETPEALADGGRSERAARGVWSEETVASTVGPLRWRVSFAAHFNHNQDDYDDCATVIALANTAPSSTEVEVEFYRTTILSGSATATLTSGDTRWFTTSGGGGGVSGGSGPFMSDYSVVTNNFRQGSARIYADDPRLMAAAFFVCRRDRLNLGTLEDPHRAFMNIPTFPVGATAEYFVAGMPTNWTPQMAAPEVPE